MTTPSESSQLARGGQAVDRRACLLDLEFGLAASGKRGIAKAVLEVVIEQCEGHTSKCRISGYESSEDVDAVLVTIDHAAIPRTCPSMRLSLIK